MIKNTIILVPFPFDDFSSTKVRPALCLTIPTGKFDHIIIAFISSKIPANNDLAESDIIINKDTIFLGRNRTSCRFSNTAS